MSESPEFKWEWCWMCRTAFVRCPRCGNNCCNGAYGELEDGSKCDVCPLAYEVQDKAWKDGTAPEIPDSEKGDDPFAGSRGTWEDLESLFAAGPATLEFETSPAAVCAILDALSPPSPPFPVTDNGELAPYKFNPFLNVNTVSPIPPEELHHVDPS